MEEEFELLNAIYCSAGELCNLTYVQPPIAKIEVQFKLEENVTCKIKVSAQIHYYFIASYIDSGKKYPCKNESGVFL